MSRPSTRLVAFVRASAGGVGVACLGLAAILTLCSVVAGAVSASHYVGYGWRQACTRSDYDDCLRVSRATVVEPRLAGKAYALVVSYDDGRRRSGVGFPLASRSLELPVGSTVRVLVWDGDVIAVYDPRDSREVKTTDYPYLLHPDSVAGAALAIVFAVLGAALTLPAWAPKASALYEVRARRGRLERV